MDTRKGGYGGRDCYYAPMDAKLLQDISYVFTMDLAGAYPEEWCSDCTQSVPDYLAEHPLFF